MSVVVMGMGPSDLTKWCFVLSQNDQSSDPYSSRIAIKQHIAVFWRFLKVGDPQNNMVE